MLAQAAEQRGDFAGRRGLAGASRQPAARARGADAPRLAAGAPGPAARRRASWCAARPSATPTTRAPSCWPKPGAARGQALERGLRGAGRRQPALPRRRRPALRAGHDGREDRPLDEMERAAAPRDRAQARPRTTPTTRWAIRWPIATCACPRRATLIQRALRAGARRPVHHRQPGLGRVPARQPRRGAAPAAPGLRGAARRRDRAPTWARCCGPRASATKRAASGAKRASRDAANDVLRETLARLQVEL